MTLFFNISQASKNTNYEAASRYHKVQKNTCEIHVKYMGKEMYDIESCNGIELGSYGIREFAGFRWIYGTGVAEPRLSLCIARKGKKRCRDHLMLE